ncbi:hypothetical protein Tco_0094051, partial [Tanacetum coccineum]
RAILIRPGVDIPISRLYRTHPGGPCSALTARKSVRPLPSHRLSSSHSSSDHSSSGHSILGHSLSRHTPPDTTDADSSTPPRIVHPSLAMTPRCSEDYLQLLVPPGSGFLHLARRVRDFISQKEVLRKTLIRCVEEDIEADAMAVKVAVDRDVKARVNASIDMEVNVRIDVEDEVEDVVESSDRGTIEVGVDVAVGINIPDAMLMPDVVEHLEQVEEGLQDIYDHVIEIPLQRIEDIETGQRELESRSLIAGEERASL